MIDTLRLQLVPLTHEQLILYKHFPEQLAHELNLNYQQEQHGVRVLADIEEAKQFWIDKTGEFPAFFEWYTNWQIILKNEKVAIGGIGFAGFPKDGSSMVGYGLDLRYHCRGYATEALRAILQWAFNEKQLQRVEANTPLWNLPSQQVLFKNSFAQVMEANQTPQWQLTRNDWSLRHKSV